MRNFLSYFIPWIRKFISNYFFLCGKVSNKLMISVIMLILSGVIAIFLLKLGISGLLSNLISIIRTVITLFNLR